MRNLESFRSLPSMFCSASKFSFLSISSRPFPCRPFLKSFPYLYLLFSSFPLYNPSPVPPPLFPSLPPSHHSLFSPSWVEMAVAYGHQAGCEVS